MKKIGMRTIKTGLGVFICAFLGPLVVQNPNMSAVACLICMQNTVSGSLETGLARIQGTIFGGIVGFIVISLFPENALVCGLGVIFTIYACNMLGLKQSVSISCITFLAIQMGFSDSSPAIVYSFNRILDTCVGVIVAIIVNFTLARPNYLNMLYSSFEKIEEDINNFLKYKILNQDTDFILEDLVENMNTMESLHSKLLGELGYQKEDININKVEQIVSICREANFHIQSIELLEKKLYLNQKSYDKLISIYNEEDIVFELDDEQSPVFNYHLMKVVENSKILSKESISYRKKYPNKRFLDTFKKND